MKLLRRREFLTLVPAAVLAPQLTTAMKEKASPVQQDRIGDLLPTRPLGRTGCAVTMLGVGGFHVGWTQEKEAAQIIETAIEGGVRFFDTAESYQEGGSEERYGKYLTPKYRDDIFLMSKSTAKDAKAAREHLEGSLRRLRTDRLDLWQIHALSSPQDVDDRLSNGVLEFFQEAKESGKVRFIGFTGHADPQAHLRMLERTADSNPFDTCQMPVNALDPNKQSFIRQVIPVLKERGIGLLAMKTLADGRFFALKRNAKRVQWQTENPAIPGRISIRDALHFAWAQPISILITGAETASLLREKIDLARTFTGMSEDLQAQLVASLSDLAEEGVEYYKKS